jgi:hypothetical protein
MRTHEVEFRGATGATLAGRLVRLLGTPAAYAVIARSAPARRRR